MAEEKQLEDSEELKEGFGTRSGVLKEGFKRPTKKNVDYSSMLDKERKLMARVDPKKTWPRQLTDTDFWFDDFEIYLRELERFVSR